MRKNKRFIVSEVEGNVFSGTAVVLVDRVTGVNYLFYKTGYGAGLTPLLDRDGNPVITTVSNNTIK